MEDSDTDAVCVWGSSDTAANTITHPTYKNPYIGSGILSQISTLDNYISSSDFDERKQLIWNSITDDTLPEISEEELIKILDMIKSKDNESLILGFRLLKGHKIPKQDFITQLIMKDACNKLVHVLHDDYA